ncbi:CsiV family protein [Thalassotalea montiporae]
MLNKKLAQLKTIIKPTCALLPVAAMLLSAPSFAARKIDKRWFEVEVILFSQLGDKTQLNENFSGQASLPRYRQVIDLLTPYLQPDTSTLELLLPSCEGRVYAPGWQARVSLPALHQAKSLDEIDQLTTEEAAFGSSIESNLEAKLESDLNPELTPQFENSSTVLAQAEQATIPEILPETLVDGELSNQQLSGGENSLTADIDVQESIVNGVSSDSSNASELPNSIETLSNDLGLVEEILPLTEEELALVADAEQTFKSPELVFDYQQVTTSEQALCQPIITNAESTISDYYALSQIADNNANNKDSVVIPIDNFSGRVDGNEFVYSNAPYLIDADSLKLKDIALQLRRSKNFKPLLHLGWRQPLTNRKKPALEPAIRLFAGDHYQEQYRQAKADYQSQLSLKALAEQLSSADESAIDDINNAELASNNQQAALLASIYQQLDEDAFTLESVLADIDNPDTSTLGLDKNSGESRLSENQLAEQVLVEPTPPNQDWLLDGLFRLHLNHYLFITADFNVAVPYTADELADQQTSEQLTDTDKFTYKLIPFSQNKRVISKEVHYFDHPYMGMVVQIRRYKPPVPETKTENEKDNG